MIERTETLYKIRRKSDGLFSTGGMCPRWEKSGKTWKKVGHVRCHLGQFGTSTFGNVRSPYYDCELVTQRLVVHCAEAQTESLEDFISETQAKRATKARKERESQARYQVEYAERQLAQAQAELREVEGTDDSGSVSTTTP